MEEFAPCEDHRDLGLGQLGKHVRLLAPVDPVHHLLARVSAELLDLRVVELFVVVRAHAQAVPMGDNRRKGCGHVCLLIPEEPYGGPATAARHRFSGRYPMLGDREGLRDDQRRVGAPNDVLIPWVPKYLDLLLVLSEDL